MHSTYSRAPVAFDVFYFFEFLFGYLASNGGELNNHTWIFCLDFVTVATWNEVYLGLMDEW